MGGFGYILAGAAKGLGDGIAEQGRSADAERRATALENLRNQNNQAEQKQRTNDQDWLNSRNSTRSTDATITINKKQGQIADARDAANFGRDVKKIGITASIDNKQAVLAGAIQRQNAQFANSLPKDATFEVSGDGYIYAADKAGNLTNTGVKAPESALYDGKGNSSGGTVLDQARGGGVAQGSAPAQATAPARPQSNAAGKLTDAQAEAFVNNPANKGKSFIGPDGKRYKVP